MELEEKILSTAELYECPIDEQLLIMPTFEAFDVVRWNVWELEHSFLTPMHQELVHHMIQRRTMAKSILFTPNICAELFTYEEYKANTRYIINKLVGRRTLKEEFIEDFHTLERQIRKKIKRFLRGKERYLIFFWGKEPNFIQEYSPKEWAFDPDSPIYKKLVRFYGRYNLISRCR